MNSEQFKDAIRSTGLVPPDHIVPGVLYRFPGLNKPKSNTAGACKMFNDGEGGWFQDFTSGIDEHWQVARKTSYSQAEREAFMRQLVEDRRLNEAEDAENHEKVAIEAAEIWEKSTPAPADHPYLVKKGIKAHGVRLSGGPMYPGAMVIPMRDAGGKLWSVQFIKPNGDKRFLKGGKVTGCYFALGTPKGATAACSAEGFATAATAHEATGHPVATAFDAGNLGAVTQTLRAKLPTLPIIVCGDDDYRTPGNPGVTKATAAARAVGGLLAMPVFGPDRAEGDTDFNDMARLYGLDAVRAALDAAKPVSGADHQPETESPPQDEGAWPEPQPIPCTLLPVEPFDNDLLPVALRAWVTDIAERMQCPPDFPAVGAMVALSSVIGRKASIKPKRYDDWQVVPNLWGAIVGRPGVMKSPALSEVMKPLDRLQIIASDLHAESMRDHGIKEKMEGMTGKAAESKAQKLIAKGNKNEAEQVLMDAADSEGLKPPALRRYKVTDATVESLGEILIENPWGTLAYRDELNGLLRSLDKEGQEGARAFYLQGYDGNQGYTFDRIQRGRYLNIPAVCISMLGGIQPGKIQAYIHDAMSGGAGDDGLLQRFGMFVWPDVVGEWRNVDRWPDTAAKNTAYEAFQRLDAVQPGVDAEGQESPIIYKFSEEAQGIFEAWRLEYETDLRSGDHHPAMESHLAKYRKLVPAIALVCALADGESEVSADSLIRSIAWSTYLKTHAQRAYAAGARPATDGAKTLLAKIVDGKVTDGFTTRDVHIKGWSQLSEINDVHAAASMLCDLDHLLRAEKPPGEKGGRPTTYYQINPKTLGGN